MKYLLGIDIGTTGVKTLLINRRGSVVGVSIKEYSLDMPQAGWAEQDPGDWWRAVIFSVRDVLRTSGIPPADITGIGLSGQMHGSVFLDNDNSVLRPCILWCDQRTEAECAYIERKIGRKRLIRLAGNPALTGFTAGKVLWVKKNEPDIYRKIRKVLLPKDYIRFRLTGAFATEVSDASGTLFLDVKNRRWSRQVMEESGVPLSFMPECRESTEISGTITQEAGRLTGLKTGTPVVGGGGDQAAQAIGTGIVRPGVVSINIGTSGVVFAYSAKPQFDPLGRIHTFCHAVPHKWHVMGVMLAAGGSLRWFRDNLGQEEARAARQKGIDPYAALIEVARKVPAGAEGLVFLPYLSGERTPYADPYARGIFFGLGLRHTKGHMIKAVLEGVCFGLRDSLGIIEEVGIPVKEIRVTGGGARSKAWIQMLSDVLNRDVVTVEPAEGSAYGAALIAGMGAGIYADAEDACNSTIRTKAAYKPSPENASIYSRRYGLFRSLYKSLKENFKTNESMSL